MEAASVEAADSLFLGAQDGGAAPQYLLLKRANRHGLVAGATGTGKTVTLQGLVEGLSTAGVPVFAADVKGDLSGLAMPGAPGSKTDAPFTKRAAAIGLRNYAYREAPVVFWDLLGESGHPVRATISDMGPMLLARLLELNDTQEGVLNIAFRAADDEGLLLLDLKDLREMLGWCADNSVELAKKYGNVPMQSVGAIQRQLLALEAQGGDRFFGEPALDIADLMRLAPDGRGQVNILMADKLMRSPKLYATFLLWLLSELFEILPEVGDPEKPKLVFFFDEAHLLFDNAPKALVTKVEQVVRLIRSKGVGVFFITQNPGDLPDTVSAQLGNRMQHALHAFTPREKKAVEVAAQSFRPNPALDVVQAISELKTGEALVSLLQKDGAPSPVERTLIRPPASRAGPLTDAERQAVLAASPVKGKYETVVDRESAYEILRAKAEKAASAESEAAAAKAAADKEKAASKTAAQSRREYRNSARGQIEHEALLIARSAGRTAVNRLVRGLLGSLMKGR